MYAKIALLTALLSSLQTGFSHEKSPPQLKQWKVKQPPVVYPVGSNVQLECPIEGGTKNLFFEWTKGNEAVDILGRYRVTMSGLLRIKAALVQDSGTYTCKAINGFGYVQTNVTLHVVRSEDLPHYKSPLDNYYPSDDIPHQLDDENLNSPPLGSKPRFIRISPVSEIQKSEGESVKFKCNAAGSPRPQIRWYKNRSPLNIYHLPLGTQRSRGMLFIPRLRHEDAGNYTCIASNGFGEVNVSFHLKVTDNLSLEPELIGSHPINTTVNVGDTATFQCKVNSEGKPYVQWLKQFDEGPLPSDPLEGLKRHLIEVHGEYYRVVKSSGSSEKEEGSFYNKLVISNAQPNNSGKYICFAANIRGYSYKSAHLKVVSPYLREEGEKQDPTYFPRDWHPIFLWIIGFIIILLLVLVSFLILYRKMSGNEVKKVTTLAETDTVSKSSITCSHVLTKSTCDADRLQHWLQEQNMDAGSRFYVTYPYNGSYRSFYNGNDRKIKSNYKREHKFLSDV